jgi:hypothetical protein
MIGSGAYDPSVRDVPKRRKSTTDGLLCVGISKEIPREKNGNRDMISTTATNKSAGHSVAESLWRLGGLFFWI